jgi:alpha-1,2-mannosyltransferase
MKMNKIYQNHRLILFIYGFVIALTLFFFSYRLFSGKYIQVDFVSFYSTGKAAAAGGNFYNYDYLKTFNQNPEAQVFPYLYPPVLALSLIPLSSLSIQNAQLIWVLGAIICFIITSILCINILKNLYKIKDKVEEGRQLIVYSIFNLLLLIILPFKNNLIFGQVNFLVLTFISLSIFFNVRNKNFLSGLLLSFAIMIKITPAFLLIYYLSRKNYKAIYGCITGLAILFLITLIAGKGELWLEFFKILPNAAYGKTIYGLFPSSAIWNFSVSGYLSRILGDNNFFVQILTISIIIITSFALYSFSKKIESAKAFNTLILYLITMVVLSPLAYVHHIIYLFPGALFLLAYIYNSFIGKKRLFLGLGTFFLLFMSSFDFPFYYNRFIHSDFLLKYFCSFNLFALISIFILAMIIYKWKLIEPKAS